MEACGMILSSLHVLPSSPSGEKVRAAGERARELSSWEEVEADLIPFDGLERLVCNIMGRSRIKEESSEVEEELRNYYKLRPTHTNITRLPSFSPFSPHLPSASRHLTEERENETFQQFYQGRMKHFCEERL